MAYSPHSLPESRKHGPQQPANGQLPHQTTRQKSEQIAKAQVPPADPEARFQPQPPGAQQKQAVPQPGGPAPEGPQEAVGQPQQAPQRPAGQKPPGRGLRSGHPKSRWRQVFMRGSS